MNFMYNILATNISMYNVRLYSMHEFILRFEISITILS